MKQAFFQIGWAHSAVSRWCVLAVLAAALAPGGAHAETSAQPRHRAQKVHKTPAPSASPPNWVSLGRYVALAPRCKLRDNLWAERLNMALSHAIVEAGVDPISGHQDLAAVEDQAAAEVAENGTTICRSLADPQASTDLRKADSLVK